jgi:hypothetical protein
MAAMRLWPEWACCAAALAAICALPCFSQTNGRIPTFRVDSSLTLVDVIAENAKTGLRTRELLTDLRREDFRIFDNGHEMPIDTFDVGAENTTRPIALWLIVQCNQTFDDGRRQSPGYHSMFIEGKTDFLKPALAHLGGNDVIGVAHWCDNGHAVLDQIPSRDTGAARAKVEEVLDQKPIAGENRSGELAMQHMIRMILENTHQTKPIRLPIFLFLYGDGCATYLGEANSILRNLLETSGMVFGINDGTWPYTPPKNFPQIASEVDPQQAKIFYLVHYYSQQTGGEVYSTPDPKLFSAALDYILAQLHFRYTLGFRPTKLDGKRHTLRVDLTDEAKKRFLSAQLRFRPEYIPIATTHDGPQNHFPKAPGK